MAENLRGRRPVAGPEALEEMVEQFLLARGRAAGAREPPASTVLRRQSAVLAEAASAVTARAALSVALGGRRGVRGLPREQLWYARQPAIDLWLRRLAGNLTLRSVVFQNAVRTALGLGVARLVAGSLDLSHGFWVLLAVLTLGRTTAGATWSAVRLAGGDRHVRGGFDGRRADSVGGRDDRRLRGAAGPLHAAGLHGGARRRRRLGAGPVHAGRLHGLRPARAGHLAARRDPGVGRPHGLLHRSAVRGGGVAGRSGRRGPAGHGEAASGGSAPRTGDGGGHSAHTCGGRGDGSHEAPRGRG